MTDDMRAEDSLLDRVHAVKLWYHTLDLAPGVVTPGWFDLRPVVNKLPWPDIRGARCLDIATYDGFFAFELERRGATEVMATDIASHTDWDWLPRDRARGPEYLSLVAGEKGRGFEVAAQALGSSVKRVFTSVYTLTADELGSFDIVVCGSLLLHLRDPFAALAAIRGICSGYFLSIEQIDLRSSIMQRGSPAFRLIGFNGQWLNPNAFGHRRMLEVAGFEIVRSTRPLAEPFGVAHPPVQHGQALLQRAFLGRPGVPVSAVLCRPDPAAGPITSSASSTKAS